MAIEFGRVVRDGGVLWVSAHLSDEAADATLRATATTPQGDEAPVRVLPAEEEGQWALGLAALSVTQTVRAQACTPEGEVAEEATYRLNPLKTRLGVSAPGRRGRMEPVTGEALLGRWDVAAHRLVSVPGGGELCQGVARLVAPESEMPEGPVRVLARDARGRALGAEPWVCLSDEILPFDGHPGFLCREVEFSLRLPAFDSALVVWVRAQDGSEVPEGFACLGPHEVRRLRSAWRSQTTPAFEDEGYDLWFREKHAVRATELALQREARLARTPLISVVLAVREADVAAIRASVDSILDQSYDRLELVLVSVSPSARRISSVLQGVGLADARVRSVPLAADFGAAAAVSEGIDAAVGDYVCVVREGDTLAPDALFCIAAELGRMPDADLIYTDEDELERGRHVRARLKPDWDPDLLLGMDYVGGLAVVRKTLLHDLPTLDRALDGAEGYYLTLYASRLAQTICHVPRVLYHRAGGRARQEGAGAVAAELVALRRHLEETGEKATARPSAHDPLGHELTFGGGGDPAPAGEAAPAVSVIIANRDGAASLDRCLTSLREHSSSESYEVIVVEQGSERPETFEYYRQAEEADGRLRVVFCQGEGRADRARMLAFGISRSKGSHLLFLDRNVEVTADGWMGRLLSLCQRHGVGAVAPRLVRADATVASSGLCLSADGPVAQERFRHVREGRWPGGLLLHGVTAASWSCLLVDGEAYRAVGGLETERPSRFGDMHLCLRLRQRGYRVLLDPQVTLTLHGRLEGPSARRTVDDLRSVGRLWEVWPYGPEETDPALNANLDPVSPYGVLAQPRVV